MKQGINSDLIEQKTNEEKLTSSYTLPTTSGVNPPELISVPAASASSSSQVISPVVPATTNSSTTPLAKTVPPFQTGINLFPGDVWKIIIEKDIPENECLNTRARLVCKAFRSHATVSGIWHFNKKQSDTAQHFNPQSSSVETLQKEEIKLYLSLENDQSFLESVSDQIRNYIQQLRAANNKDSALRFLLCERILDNLNVALIEECIEDIDPEDPNKLDCSSMHLTRFPGRILLKPNLREFWSNLEYLELGSNHLRKLPQDLRILQSLTHLSLYENDFETFPEVIFELPTITFLNLNMNHITAIPSKISNLRNVDSLYLSDNELCQLPNEIVSMQNLTALFVCNNYLRELPQGLNENILLKDFPTDNQDGHGSKQDVLDSQRMKQSNKKLKSS